MLRANNGILLLGISLRQMNRHSIRTMEFGVVIARHVVMAIEKEGFKVRANIFYTGNEYTVNIGYWLLPFLGW